jgi:aryl-alcohol dehydrogenase
VPARLALAKELGATDTIDSSATDAGQAVRELTRTGVDFTFNTTRSAAIFSQAMACLAPRGIAGFVAAPLDSWTPEMFHILAGGRTLRGILGGDSTPRLFIPLLIEYFRQGRLPFDRLIRFYKFQEIEQAFHDLEKGVTIKAVLRM